MRTSLILHGVLCVGIVFSRITDPESYQDGSDLEHFVSRPDIAAPRYAVVHHHPEAISDGFWFVAPYTALPNRPPFNGRREYVPCQTGAHIYDNHGTLIWSAACKYSNRNTYGFLPVVLNGSQFLSFHQAGEDLHDGIPRREASVIIDDQYQEHLRLWHAHVDMHEFNILPNGRTAIFSTQTTKTRQVTNSQSRDRSLTEVGFVEIDLWTNEVVFEWEALTHGISEEESWDLKGKAEVNTTWDAFHINSVDKDKDGDYYISLRHTLTVYKISGQDGHVIWRLGGSANQFHMERGVRFVWQHHIRIRLHNATHTIISLFDNGSEDQGRASGELAEERSVAKFIVLNTSTMTAKILRSFERPDGGQSRKHGCIQLIGEEQISPGLESIMNNHVFVNWAEQGYISEYDSASRILFEARFISDRFKSYRSYKYPFVGRPIERPALKILRTWQGQDGRSVASHFYVSWNGATEVSLWCFYGSRQESGPFERLACVQKTGFETSWAVFEPIQYGYAEAIDASGENIGASSVTSMDPPSAALLNSKFTNARIQPVPLDLHAFDNCDGQVSCILPTAMPTPHIASRTLIYIMAAIGAFWVTSKAIIPFLLIGQERLQTKLRQRWTENCNHGGALSPSAESEDDVG